MIDLDEFTRISRIIFGGCSIFQRFLLIPRLQPDAMRAFAPAETGLRQPAQEYNTADENFATS
ncbi:MAG: hypothetical protein ACK4NW_05065 [Roseinatronobacter sp.]